MENNEANLNEILEVYNNTELEDGMVLAPNPMEEETSSVNEIYKVYQNTEKGNTEGDLSEATVDLSTQTVVSSNPKTNTNSSKGISPVAIAIVAFVLVIAVVGTIIAIRRKNR